MREEKRKRREEVPPKENCAWKNQNYRVFCKKRRKKDNSWQKSWPSNDFHIVSWLQIFILYLDYDCKSVFVRFALMSLKCCILSWKVTFERKVERKVQIASHFLLLRSESLDRLGLTIKLKMLIPISFFKIRLGGNFSVPEITFLSMKSFSCRGGNF